MYFEKKRKSAFGLVRFGLLCRRHRKANPLFGKDDVLLEAVLDLVSLVQGDVPMTVRPACLTRVKRWKLKTDMRKK